ncbi:collagenase-like [Anopheles cruzii]|uniref:collagenase-like n=1 Tax=Anopheles cruzii TaxID=68878 RepID=UPI0022EC86B6|nr:collagenase-like [Anopheles cruzii]
MQWPTKLLLLAGLAVCCAYAAEVKTNRNPRIVNGSYAPTTPYNVYVLYLNSGNAGFFGGGSLISDRHVLTAAQNIQGFVRWEMGLGSTVFSQLSTMVSTQAIPHPSFNSVNRANDIGIIILPSPVAFTATVSPVTLPVLNRHTPYENEEGKIVGFGFNSVNGQVNADFLMLSYQRVIGDSRCSGIFQITLPYHFCAEDTLYRSNICNGDLGAGFIILDQRVETLVGVASLITASCDSQQPTGYTRISSYRQWIRDSTGV